MLVLVLVVGALVRAVVVLVAFLLLWEFRGLEGGEVQAVVVHRVGVDEELTDAVVSYALP